MLQLLLMFTTASITEIDISVKLVNFVGLQHHVVFEFCLCESEAVTLVRNRFWPGTPAKPSVAFSFDFLEILRVMKMDRHVSLSGCWRAMQLVDRASRCDTDVSSQRFHVQCVGNSFEATS